jgi:hypothetical protein
MMMEEEDNRVSISRKKEREGSESEIYGKLNVACAQVLEGMAEEEEVEFRELMQSEQPSIKSLSQLLSEAVDKKALTSFSEFEDYLDGLLLAKIDALSKLSQVKKALLGTKKTFFLEELMERI